MDEAIELVRSYAQHEYDVLMGAYLEPDQSAFEQAVRDAERHFHRTPRTTLTLSVSRFPAAADTPAQRAMAQDVTARRILQVKHYRHPSWGDLYAVYATSPSKMFGVLMYGDLFYVARVEDEWKIVARYQPAFPDKEEGVAWEWAGGARIDDPGEPVEVRKLLAPTAPAHLADYNSD